MLVTYAALEKLPDKEWGENPTVGALTDINAHVVYFYSGQQVLCTKYEECRDTPGWYPSDVQNGKYPFPFGPPLALGTRYQVAHGGRHGDHVLEPGCMAHSDRWTKGEKPEDLLENIKTWTLGMITRTAEFRPVCFPFGAPIPEMHKPTLFYVLDGWVTASPEEKVVQQDRMRGIKALYTRGEGYTVKTDAERTNFLLLTWFLKLMNQQTFTRPNAIMMEFAGSAMMPIIRIIESQQNRPECGWAIHCKASGSCWADTLLGEENKCIPEGLVLKTLVEHADGKKDTTAWVIYATIMLTTALLLQCLCWSGWKILKAPPSKAEGTGETTEEIGQENEDTGETGESGPPSRWI
jgi:hypothetical protein